MMLMANVNLMITGKCKEFVSLADIASCLANFVFIERIFLEWFYLDSKLFSFKSIFRISKVHLLAGWQ